MKTSVFILLLVVIVCIQCELSSVVSAKNTGRVRRRIASKSISEKSQNKSSFVGSAANENATIIKGEKGVIKKDGKVVGNFKNGVVQVSISRGCIYINDKLILKRTPTSNNFGTTNINGDEVKKFEIEVKKNGKVYYNDDEVQGITAQL